jgi:hypothetical protein
MARSAKGDRQWRFRHLSMNLMKTTSSLTQIRAPRFLRSIFRVRGKARRSAVPRLTRRCRGMCRPLAAPKSSSGGLDTQDGKSCLDSRIANRRQKIILQNMYGTKVGRIVVPALDNVTRINYKNVILQNYAVTTVEVVERAGIGAKRRLARRATARRGILPTDLELLSDLLWAVRSRRPLRAGSTSCPDHW